MSSAGLPQQSNGLMTKESSITQTKKQAFLRKDRLVRGITEDGFLKVVAVKTTQVVRTAKERHKLSLLSTVMLGRAMTGAMLLAAELKGEERIHVRFEGNGPIGSINVEANHAGEIRGYVRHPQAALDMSQPQVKLEDGLGIGLMHLTRVLFNEAQPVTGTVELAHSNISGDYAHYLVNSAQVPSAILLDVSIDEEGEVQEAGGVLVQALPDAPQGHIDLVEKNFAAFGSVTEYLHQDDHYVQQIIHDILDPLPTKELAKYPVDFFCRCNKERFINALATLGLSELNQMKDEEQELVCHYCNEAYIITPDEISHLIQQLQ